MPISSASYIDVPCQDRAPFTYKKEEKIDFYTLNIKDLSEQAAADDEKQPPTHPQKNQ